MKPGALSFDVTVFSYSSRTKQWLRRVLACPSGSLLDDENRWAFDTTVAHRESLCWADYRQGCFLHCKILSDAPTMMRTELPPMTPNDSRNREDLWRLRCMSVTASQSIVFVDIHPEPGIHECSIRVWSLDNHGYTWSVSNLIRVRNFREIPCFPLIGGLDAGTLYTVTACDEGVNHVYAVRTLDARLLAREEYCGVVWSVIPNTPYLGSQIAEYVVDKTGIMRFYLYHCALHCYIVNLMANASSCSQNHHTLQMMGPVLARF